MRFKAVPCGLIFMLGASLAALAADKIDPEDVRVITPTEATSDCINDPKTPLCAVETLLACVARQERPLCERVGVRNIEYSGQQWEIPYRVLSSRIIEERDIPPELRNTNWMRVGYAEVSLRRLDFDPGECPAGCLVVYFVKPAPDGWEVVGWSMAGYDNAP